VHGELEVEKVLHAVIDQALGTHAVRPAAVCLGIAGVDREDDGRVMHGIMHRLGFKARTLIVNDALVALMAGARSGPAVVVVSGTGSIAYGVDEHGRAARAGGWGATLGDEGSAYWVGRRALTAVARAADGRGPRTALTELVLAHFGLTRPDQLVGRVCEEATGHRAVAALGEVVERARVAGDPVAAEILHEAAAELAGAAASVIARLQLGREPFPALLAGGFLKGVPWLAGEVARLVTEGAPRAMVSVLGVEPAVGAVRLALAEARGGARVPVYL
jgi:N-acetylglucosamine kinase-like BadF-type ATPase